MPTYEYVCAKCEHHFELVQRLTDKPLKVCPKELCHLKRWGKGKVKRALGAGANLIFKGSGFYATDYRSENYKAGAKKEAGAVSGGSSGGPKKETKSSDSTAAKPAVPAPAARPPSAASGPPEPKTK
jgi:putative FmdB family regulatory protein